MLDDARTRNHDRLELSCKRYRTCDTSICICSSLLRLEHSLTANATHAQNLYSVAETQGFELPDKCTVAPQNDMLLPHERGMKQMRGTRFRCEICGTSFTNQLQMDNHMSTRHLDVLDSVGRALSLSAAQQSMVRLID